MINDKAPLTGPSVSAKVQAIIQLTGALAILVVGAAQFLYNLQIFQAEVRASLEQRVKLTVFHSVAPLEFDDSTTAQAAVNYLAEDPDVLSALILREDGTVLAEYEREKSRRVLSSLLGYEALLSENVYSPDGAYSPGARLVGTAMVRADLSSRIFWHAVTSLLWTVAVMSLAFFIGFLVSRPLLRRVLLPVFQLTETVQRIGAEQQFGLRAKKISNDEFGVLVDQFNAMLDQLQDRDRALAESEAQYRSLVNNINVGICLVTTGMTDPPLRANPAAARILGFDSAEALCKVAMTDLCDEASDWKALLNATVEWGAIKNKELRMRTHQKESRWISFSAQRESQQSGPALLNCVLEDITEQKVSQEELLSYRNHLEELVRLRTQELEEINMRLSGEISDRLKAEEALMEQLHFEQALLDSLPTPVIVNDAEKRYLGCNDAFEAMIGLDKSMIVGNAVESVLDQPYRDVINEEESEAIRDGQVRYLKIPFSSTGERQIYQVQKAPFHRSDGTRGGVVTAFHNVTALKDAEEASRLSKERMEEINEELKNFVYIVSHDLRAPLTNINGYSRELRSDLVALKQALEEDRNGLEHEAARKVRPLVENDIPESIDFIGHSVRRMEELVSAIFKLSRLGQRVLHFEAVNMNELVAEVLQSFAHGIEEKQVKVQVIPLPRIIADHVAMGQIVANLVDNALKYLAPGRPGEIEIGGEEFPGHCAFYVRDNGVGISDADSSTIFDMFRRGGETAVPGEGIGLTFVRTLVRRHGGELRVESVLGEGSCFRFTIAKGLRNLEENS